jgi:PAS domain S-box-containing protein
VKRCTRRGAEAGAQEARHQEQKCRAILSSITDCFYALDREWRFSDVNSRTEVDLGRKRERLVGETLWELFPESRGSEFERQFRHAAAEQAPAHFECLSPVTGRWAELHVYPSPGGLSVYCHDVSERKQLELALREQAEALRQVDERKELFLTMLAHELRNPLATLQNGLTLARLRSPGDPHQERPREQAERQVQRMLRLVDDLLDRARIQRGKLDVHRERLDLIKLLGETAEDRRADLTALGLTLSLQLPPGPAWIEGDSVRLAQVVDNLLTNAAKFTDPGGTVTLRADVYGADRQVTVSVSDSGIGIKPEMLPYLFDRFAQGPESRGRSQGGLGLGLSLVKALVELHGGAVEARSDGPGHGAEFCVTLPLAAPPRETERVPGSGKGGRPTPLAEAALRILLVEDNTVQTESLRYLLEQHGHSVAVAGSAAEAMEVARQFHPDVALCDIALPDADGCEVAAALRRDPATAAARHIAFTGYDQPELSARAAAGFDLRLTKPIAFEQLEQILTRETRCP